MTIGYYCQVIISLLILAAIMWGVLKATRKIQKQTFSGDIKVIDRKPLGNTVALAIVEIRQKQYLVSVGANNVQLLEKLEN